ncbi:MAG: tRNA (adenosine(37)-N6)-threonylcarbamoyltransferase complex dimerization subunit type 1 TsaB [Ginsengibacter sp.]
MPLILHIDTSTENAIISISKNENVIHSITNNRQKDHASFLQPAIKQLLQQTNILIRQLNAVSVTEGPGSYTGLRVGMASAKGLCYALQIPLITLSTLEVMAISVIENTNEPQLYLYCPMIDARRMEVFTAIFDDQLNELQSPRSLVLELTSFANILEYKQIIFSGNGSKKFENLFTSPSGLLFSNTYISTSALARICIKKFHKKKFADLSNAAPVYIKEFYTIKK